VKLLSESGQVQTVILLSGEARYEHAQLDHHHHVHCRICQTVPCPGEPQGGAV